jgi:hypothetical protein
MPVPIATAASITIQVTAEARDVRLIGGQTASAIVSGEIFRQHGDAQHKGNNDQQGDQSHAPHHVAACTREIGLSWSRSLAITLQRSR